MAHLGTPKRASLALTKRLPFTSASPSRRLHLHTHRSPKVWDSRLPHENFPNTGEDWRVATGRTKTGHRMEVPAKLVPFDWTHCEVENHGRTEPPVWFFKGSEPKAAHFGDVFVSSAHLPSFDPRSRERPGSPGFAPAHRPPRSGTSSHTPKEGI